MPGGTFLQDTEGLIRWIKDHNRDVAAQAARVSQARAQLDRSELWPNPSATFGIGNINVGELPTGISAADTQNYSVGLQQPIELGKRGPRMESARLALDAERKSYLAIVGEKVALAREALGRIVYIGARLSVLAESLAAARQGVELERVRLDHGDISASDFERLQLETTLLELEVPPLRAEREAARETARALLDAPVLDEPADVSVLIGAARVGIEPADLAGAVAQRPDAASLALAAESSRQDALLARRHAIPDPVVGVTYVHDRFTSAGNLPDGVAVTVGLPLPIFDHGQHDAVKADARADELAQTRAGLLQQARADVASLLQRRASLEGGYDLISRDALPRSRQVLDAARAAYERGQSSLTDLLLARRTHTDLVLKQIDLAHEAFAVRNELRRALGLDAQLADSAAGITP